jgi:hypothetical protein
MVLEWTSSPPPSPVCRRFSAPMSLDRNLPIFFLLTSASPLAGCAASSRLPAAAATVVGTFLLTEVGISGCEKAAAASAKEEAATTWTELTSAESAARWRGGDEPPEEHADVVAEEEEEEARLVVGPAEAEAEAERCARRSRRQYGQTPLDVRWSGCRLHRSSHSDRRMAEVPNRRALSLCFGGLAHVRRGRARGERK